MTPILQTIPLDHIHRSHANPRSDPDVDLDSLAASIGTEAEPTMVQPPVVEQINESEYTIIAGERRILAARQAGWQSIPCIVHSHLTSTQAHLLRLVENLHRRDLHPLDEAMALKIAWLTANAESIGLGDETNVVLGQDTTPTQTLGALESLLESKGFAPNHPAVTWDALLRRLGLDLDAERRKKLMSVLNIEANLQEQVRALDVTEAALRSISTLDAEEQQRLVAEITEDPALTRKVRRIARVVRDGTYSLDEALAEARGQVPGDLPGDVSTHHADSDSGQESGGLDDHLLDDRPMRGAMELLEIANRLTTALATLADAGDGDLSMLPQPWGEYAREALDLIQSETHRFYSREKE
jgi:ParB-like chromosome segregation protein Spo0J